MALFEELAQHQDAKLKAHKTQPLADKLRPDCFSQICGQRHVMDENGSLTQLLQSKKPKSTILWGPAGCGKTTIARVMMKCFDNHSIEIRAMFSGVAELKKIFADSALARQRKGQPMILFVDEIHRFNRSQQDSFLPVLENGDVILLGATTENPSFELNSALLSRVSVVRLERLEADALEKILQRAEKFYQKNLPIKKLLRKRLIDIADGDGRYLLGMVERIFEATKMQQNNNDIEQKKLEMIIMRKMPQYDKDRDGHYNLISALHKSVRGSDVQASLYWFARMLAAGEDRRYLARRLIRIASEDIGLADPLALNHAVAAMQAYAFLGSPEGELALVNCVIYLASAAKSNAAYKASKNAGKMAIEYGSVEPPLHILNPATEMMKDMGYAQGYKYDHDYQYAFAGQQLMPEKLQNEVFYCPSERGYEKIIKKRMEFWQNIKKKLN